MATGRKTFVLQRPDSIPNDDMLFGSGSEANTPSVPRPDDGTSDGEENCVFVEEKNQEDPERVPGLDHLHIDSSVSSVSSHVSPSGIIRRKSSSDTERKRKSFRNSRCNEVDDGGDRRCSSFNRTQSLPDLVEGLNGKERHNNAHSFDISPDVVVQPLFTHHRRSKQNGRLSLQRSVSFQEKATYIGEEDESVFLPPDIDEGYPTTPVTERPSSTSSDAEQKRRNFSEGYGTEGSAGSKASSIQSMISQEKQEAEAEVETRETDDGSETPVDSYKSGLSENTSSGTGSTVTVMERLKSPEPIIGQLDEKNTSEGIPFLSIFGTSASQDGPTIPVLTKDVDEVSRLKRQAQIYKQLNQSVDKSLNLPNFLALDDSVQISDSLIYAVDQEDKKLQEKFVQQYCDNTENQISPPSFNPSLDATRVLEEQKQGFSQNRNPLHASEQNEAERQSSKPVPIDGGARPKQRVSHRMGAVGMTGSPDLLRKSDTAACHRLEEILSRYSPSSLQSLALKLGFSSDSSTPSPSPLQAISPMSVWKLLNMSPPPPEEKKLTIKELEEASRCEEKNCSRAGCQKLRLAEQHVDNVVNQTAEVDSYVMDWCTALFDHCQDCEDLRCPVTFCQQMLKWCPETFAVEKVLSEIRLLKHDPLMNLSPTGGGGSYTQLQVEADKSLPQEFVDQIPIARLGTKPSSAALLFDIKSQKSQVLKEYPILEERQQVAVYRKLRNLDHPHIVKQMSFTEYPDLSVLHVRSEFMHGGSLKDHLLTCGCLTWPLVVQYMKQILDAVLYLHQRDIIFLYWTCANVFFKDTNRQSVSIGNFSLSCTTDHDSLDIGGTKISLPANLVPPEMVKSLVVGKKSDSRGLGCLVAEMLIGKPVWHHLHHDDRDTVHKLMYIEKVPPFPDASAGQLSPGVMSLLNKCWQEDPALRPNLQDLKNYFQSVKIPTLGR